ncbi:MAG: hypothetical protein LUG18_11395 [Candidatus Azobacteroides sp.]|nr:hypothetical protein [Candidatus Azobacteroides sp.]
MKIKLPLLGLTVFCLGGIQLNAQESELTEIQELQQRTEVLETAIKSLKKLKVSGYIQTQYQHGEKDASLKVGNSTSNDDKSFERIGIRRGRIKFTYDEGIGSAVFQLDITEKGVSFKDAYLNLKDPWFNTSSLRAGIFDRPFGYEISYSSSRRESPERSAIFQALFPDERDLGAMLILQPSKTSPLNFLKLEAGLFAGNGISQEVDNRKDFIGHLSASKKIGKNTSFGLGVSGYFGSVYQGKEKVFKIENGGFVANEDEANIGKYARRKYMGFDGQISHKSTIGKTQLRAEYLFGQQPGKASSAKSPNGGLPDYDTYIRDFCGGYVILVQDLGTSPFSLVAKYDWYDPNTKISKNEVGQNGTSVADRAQNTWGVGALWNATENVRLQAYYEFNNYEKTDFIAGNSDLKANVFTLRLQYKF